MFEIFKKKENYNTEIVIKEEEEQREGADAIKAGVGSATTESA